MPTTTTRRCSSSSPRRTTRSGAAFSYEKDELPEQIKDRGEEEEEEDESEDDDRDNDNNDEEENENENDEVYYLDGVAYRSYQDMVDAKRRRNQRKLQESGLLEAVQAAKTAAATQTTKTKTSSSRGLVAARKRKSAAAAAPRRKSSRLQGVPSDGLFVDDKRAGRFTVKTSLDGNANASGAAADNIGSNNRTEEQRQPQQYYRNRINDNGDPVTVAQAVERAGPKWTRDDSVALAERFVRRALLLTANNEAAAAAAANNKEDNNNDKNNKTSSSGSSKRKSSPRSVVVTSSSLSATPRSSSTGSPAEHNDNDGAAAAAAAASLEDAAALFDALAADSEDCVAKVCPDRIYSMAVHPGVADLVVAAGDKSGHVGLWHVNSSSSNNSDGVHLFRPHTGAVSCLEWTGGGGGAHSSPSNLFSASYDGTCRLLDVETGHFRELFATFDDDKLYRQRAGFGLDTGSHFWTQFGCLDRSSSSQECLFLSTSVGTALHVDLRAPRHITWHEELSEKKINTLSLHPNGYSLLSAGLDCTVNLWDVRQLRDSRKGGRHKAPTPIARYSGGRSVNSAFFSASGKYVVSTTMADKLDIFENFHLAAGSKGKSHTKKAAIVKPLHSIRHDNKTGRWLTTFQAIFHPAVDNVFAVGSMRKPRCLEFFDAATGTCRRAVTGDALTAVASRLAFHPRADRVVLVGGNSSGRVTVVQ